MKQNRQRLSELQKTEKKYKAAAASGCKGETDISEGILGIMVGFQLVF